MVALDRFDGRVWRASDLFAHDGEPVEGTQALPGAAAVDAIRLEQEIEISDLSVQWLPAAYQPVEVALSEDFTARHDLVSSVLVGEGETPDGYRYRVTSDVVVPSAQELERAYEGRVVSASVEPYTHLPVGVPIEIYGLAQEIAGDGPPFQQVLAIQEYLRRFSYDEKAPAGHGIDDMLFFLKRSQRGYCEQFAGTMAVLVRTLGLPARVAVGFLPGDRSRGGIFRVTSDHIHAWPEVYFPAFGWVAFEPTPTRSNPQARYLAGAPLGVRPDANLPGAGGSTDESPRGQPQQAFEQPSQVRGPGAAGAGPRTVRRFPWGRLALGLLTLALLAGVLIPAGKALARRLAVSRAASPRRKVIAAYSVLEASAADLGIGRKPGETLWEYRTRLRDGVGFSDGHLERITGLTGRALYSTSPVRAQDAIEAALASRQVMADLRRHVGAARRVAGAVRISRPG
jgi:transglutaminase-like putative cysteine protease